MSIYTEQLQRKRSELLHAIAEIDHLLKLDGVQPIGHTAGDPVGCPPNYRMQRPTKKDAILEVLKQAKRPLKVGELLQGIIEAGFEFRSRYPRNTLNPLLYGAKRLDFVVQIQQGFVLRGREEEFGAPQVNKPEEAHG
jgi:hypothetical protein